MELLLHQWEDWPELYRNTDKTEVTEIVIIDSQINYRGKLDTYLFPFSPLTAAPLSVIISAYSAMNDKYTEDKEVLMQEHRDFFFWTMKPGHRSGLSLCTGKFLFF